MRKTLIRGTIILLIIIFTLTSCENRHIESIDDSILIPNIILLGHRDWKTNIENISNILSNKAKAELLRQAEDKYNSINKHGDIKPINIKIISTKSLSDGNTGILIVRYSETEYYDTIMSTIACYKVKEGKIDEIKIIDSSYDNDIYID